MKGTIGDTYHLLTVLRTVSNASSQVTRAQSRAETTSRLVQITCNVFTTLMLIHNLSSCLCVYLDVLMRSCSLENSQLYTDLHWHIGCHTLLYHVTDYVSDDNCRRSTSLVADTTPEKHPEMFRIIETHMKSLTRTVSRCRIRQCVVAQNCQVRLRSWLPVRLLTGHITKISPVR